MIHKILYTILVILFTILISGCGTPKPTYENKQFIQKSNSKLIYLIVTDEYIPKKELAEILNRWMKYYFREHLGSDVIIIHSKDEVKDKNSILVETTIERIEDGFKDFIQVSSTTYDNQSDKVLFEFEHLTMKRIGWNAVTKRMAEHLSSLIYIQFNK